MPSKPLWRECTGEAVGTFILVLFGVGAVHAAALTGAQSGLWQVAVVWGVAVALAIYAVGAISGAHINPAMTVAFAVFRKFPLRKVGPYVLAQLAGAFLAAALLFALYGGVISRFEQSHGLVRGQAGSERSAMVYGEYFPNPTAQDASPEAVSLAKAMLAEGVGTAMLAFFVFAVTDRRNSGRPSDTLVAVFIGLAVAIIISIIAPLTQAGLNPARDFGPRLFSFLAGWGSIAIPGPRGGFFTVYILAPVLGGLAGAAGYECLRHSAAWTATRIVQQSKESHQMAKVKMIIVGGFLGAGKTTLLAKAAERLAGRSVKVGLITNDQAVNLVDTGVLRQAGQEVKEVAGACFCCAFNRLLYVCDELIASFNPDVIIGEPVGSCTDLSATVLQPMKKLCRDTFDLSPFTVLIDPAEFLRNFGADDSTVESVRYIYRKQIEEADLLVVNKADTISQEELQAVESLIRREFPGIPVMTMAATSGNGVDEWLDVIMAGGKAGQRIAEVDYDVYADGEAALGWLNAAVRLNSASSINWRALGTDLMGRMQTRLVAASAQIAHLKILLTSQGESLKMSLTGNTGEPSLHGAAPSSGCATLVVNARVRANPEELKAIVERCIKDAAGKAIAADVAEITSFRPNRPNPVHRFPSVVDAAPAQ